MDENSETRKVLADNLRRFRKLADLSQLGLANRIGVPANFINAIEQGKKWVSAETLDRLAAAFQIPVYLLFLPDEAKPSPDPMDLVSDFRKELDTVISAFSSKITKNQRP